MKKSIEEEFANSKLCKDNEQGKYRNKAPKRLIPSASGHQLHPQLLWRLLRLWVNLWVWFSKRFQHQKPTNFSEFLVCLHSIGSFVAQEVFSLASVPSVLVLDPLMRHICPSKLDPNSDSNVQFEVKLEALNCFCSYP